MVSEDVNALSHRTAVGVCSLAAQSRQKDMQTLVGLYVKDAEELEVPVRDALLVLLNSVIGLAVFTADTFDEAATFFDDLAQKMAVKG